MKNKEMTKNAELDDMTKAELYYLQFLYQWFEPAAVSMKENYDALSELLNTNCLT